MRKRLTRKNRTLRAAAPPALPGYAVPGDDPSVDAYGIDSPTDFGAEPDPGPYENGPPPATPGYGKSAGRNIRASMERKAAKCIRIAQAMLGSQASVSDVEDQALDLMDLDDRQIQASLARIAESFMLAEDHHMSGQNTMYGEDHMGQYDYMYAMEEPMMVEEDLYEEPGLEEDMLMEMMAEEEDDDDVEAMLTAMMREQSRYAAKRAESEEKKEKDEEGAEAEAAKTIQEEVEEEAKEKKASIDPMGLNMSDEDYTLAELFNGRSAKKAEEDKDEKEDHDEGAIKDDEDHIEALEVDKDEEEEDLKKEEKKAALRPQPRKSSNGVSSLGSISKAASSEINDLSSLWKTSPDVSKVFG